MRRAIGVAVRRDLIVSWQGGEPLAEQSLSGTRISISSDVLLVLAVYRPGMTAEDLSAALALRNYEVPDSEASAVLENLTAAGVLEDGGQENGEPGAARILGDETWGRRWGTSAARFHFSSRYPESVGESVPGPVTVPVFQRYPDVPRCPLPGPAPLPAVPFAGVLAGRRTIRKFAGTPLNLQMVSQLLYYTQFPQHLVQSEPYGWLPRRAYANGGARGELELYVLARHVSGLDPGVYHYQVDGHQLARLGPDPGDDSLLDMAFGQEMCTTAPLHLIVTGVPGRCSVKYGTARALRVIYTDVGCLAQVWGMVATALGLGAYTTMAFHDGNAEQMLGIDPVRETPLILLGAGPPGRQDPEQVLPCSPGSPLPGELVEEITGRPY